jgi:uncharacterized membrane protein YqjE
MIALLLVGAVLVLLVVLVAAAMVPEYRRSDRPIARDLILAGCVGVAFLFVLTL